MPLPIPPGKLKAQIKKDGAQNPQGLGKAPISQGPFGFPQHPFWAKLHPKKGVPKKSKMEKRPKIKPFWKAALFFGNQRKPPGNFKMGKQNPRNPIPRVKEMPWAL